MYTYLSIYIYICYLPQKKISICVLNITNRAPLFYDANQRLNEAIELLPCVAQAALLGRLDAGAVEPAWICPIWA